MATRTKRTPKKGAKPRRNWKPKFLKAFRESCNVARSAEAAGIARSAVYKARTSDEKFAEAWDEAEEKGVDSLVEEAVRRAKDGVEKPIYQNGVRVGQVQVYSDTLLIFLLKCHRPTKYRETFRQEVSGPDGGPIEFSSAEEEELVSKVEQMASRKTRPAKKAPPRKATKRSKRKPRKKAGKPKPQPM